MALRAPEIVEDAIVAWDEGVLTYVGPADGGPVDEAIRVEGAVVPGFVDGHTHLPFVGWRDDEFEMRLAGRSYRDLHGEGGIARSARMLSEASDDEAIESCLRLVREMADHGTTALELKTGYGLSVEAELRQARLARRLADVAPQTCVVTLLACHAVPASFERAAWVQTACAELIPAAAAEHLVDAVDIYVEDIAFTLDDLRSVAHAANAAGLPLRTHADQLGPSGAAEAAAALGAVCVDHLNHVSHAGVEALGTRDTVAMLLPASTFFLRAEPPPVGDLLDAGAAIGIATDCNPGTSPVCSMPEAIMLACSLYGLPPLAALVAATANPARALGLEDRLGTLEVGKRADLVVLDGPSPRIVAYRPGHDPVAHTVAGGVRIGGTGDPSALHPG